MGGQFPQSWLDLFKPVTPPVVKPVLPPPSTTAPIKGIDVSHYEPIVDWAKVKDSGIDFVFIKATEAQKDQSFDSHWAGSKAAGLIRGAYHFFHPSLDPITQAQLLTTAVGKLEADDLPCVVDLETLDSQSQASVVESLTAFLVEVHALTGKPPIIYGSPYFLIDLKLDDSFSNYPLWIAHYGVDTPKIPGPWLYWSFWQTNDKGTVLGIDGDCDMDLFNGSLEQLKKIASGS